MDELELLDRGKQIAVALGEHLPPSYPDAIEVLLRSLGPEHATDELVGVGMAPFFYLPHVLFVAERGLDHFELSMRAQYELTKRFSAEFSIRPYIARDPERTFAVLREWARDENAHVRRLVSEGTRLRLPWASRVEWLDRNPNRVLDLLELLKADPTTLARTLCAANRSRHLRTVFSVSPSSLPISALLKPAAASRTMLALSTSRCALVARRATSSSTARTGGARWILVAIRRGTARFDSRRDPRIHPVRTLGRQY